MWNLVCCVLWAWLYNVHSAQWRCGLVYVLTHFQLNPNDILCLLVKLVLHSVYYARIKWLSVERFFVRWSACWLFSLSCRCRLILFSIYIWFVSRFSPSIFEFFPEFIHSLFPHVWLNEITKCNHKCKPASVAALHVTTCVFLFTLIS